MASNGPWDMPQPHTQPQHTWNGGASDNLPPPPTYEEAMNSTPQPYAPSYHPSAPTVPYPSSYPYPTSSCMSSAPTTNPTTTLHYPTAIPHPITVLRPNTVQHNPLLVPPGSEPRPVVVVAQQPSQQEDQDAGTGKKCIKVLATIVIVGVIAYLLKRLIMNSI